MVDAITVDLGDIQGRSGMGRAFPASYVALDTARLWLDIVEGKKQLVVIARPEAVELGRFTGIHESFGSDYVLQRCPLDTANAIALRMTLPWLQPVPLGLTPSVGFGDRLGLATPGHVRALRRVASGGAGGSIVPIFAQQSIREMQRTRRSAVDVLADATWGAFQAGWRGPVGADADHLKTTADIDITADAGYTFFTVDPGSHVDDAADHAPPHVIQHKLDELPWPALETTPRDLRTSYAGKTIDLDDRQVEIGDEQLDRAAVKYGRAIAHVTALYRHLASRDVPFELEVSVDETEQPTTPLQHLYIASELQRLGVKWVSLAPRYPGKFEKGVEFAGDLEQLTAGFEAHAAIARARGPYKLSLHSGSDKFLVYPLLQKATRGVLHLKTAGTTYLEALRVVAHLDSTLFRAILDHARERYPAESITYSVSADPQRIPAASTLRDQQLPDLLNSPDARQILHVTFGSTLQAFGGRLIAVLHQHEEAYAQALETHFVPHLTPLLRPPTAFTLSRQV